GLLDKTIEARRADRRQTLTGREQQEVLEQDAAVARFVRMFPTRAALVPVFKRFLEMKLDRVDQLAIAAFDHHLVAAEVRRRQQLETLRHAIELQSVVLTNVQDVRTARFFRRFTNGDVREDGIV